MERKHKPGDWHWWFAWRPVVDDSGRVVWMKRIWRRQRHSPPSLPHCWTWFEYHQPTGWVEERTFL